MFEEEFLLGHVLFAPVGLNKDSGPRRLLGRTGPQTGPGPSQPFILGQSPQILYYMNLFIKLCNVQEAKIMIGSTIRTN